MNAMEWAGAASTALPLVTALEGGHDMAKGTCSVDGCERALSTRGWCKYHYHRWLRNGSPDVGLVQGVPAHERVLARTVRGSDGCWRYTGTLYRNGYGGVRVGSLKDGSRRNALVHRVVYEALVAAIPDGLTIDHLCATRHCVNPDHMEVVTRGENTRRGVARRLSPYSVTQPLSQP